ncbi:MAG: HAMP domain-containing sensor histidine kinase [Polaromonas sp.]|uniref:sensor histidine kinase n=1 Tax=Polaromonas sp. TaxID=1869339 RepID=UPI002733DE4D|nr:HAMP domain-containing sensor histidine kinase [Polaromonas sp.]MDP3798121.1 HAMP domain-containing sensor histidine kinase [Polaromonas sp.]
MPSPLEPILHPSPWRLRLIGLSLLLGNPLFGWIWSSWLVQPYESPWLRGVMSALGGVLMLPPVISDLSSPVTRVLVPVITWVELPFFFSWMYLNNAGGTVWLSSMCAMILIYYHLTDWRIATVGTISGALVAWGLLNWLPHQSVPLAGLANLGAVDAVVIAFSWGCAILLGLSSANLRREQLAHTLTTIGIMAHELRTPLSTAALIGDAIQLEIERQPEHPRAQQFEKLAVRLHGLVRHMNHQIDTQIANAKLLQLPRYDQRILASKLVNEVTSNYPYQSTRQRECVQVLIRTDFVFRASFTQFSQVLDNMIKNALHSLMAADSKYPPGALRIEVGVARNRGRIVVADDGMGIDPALQAKIFKPFFSSNRGTGHGLGLAFCQQVVQSAGGSIHVKSEFAVGAIFTIDLPLAGS